MARSSPRGGGGVGIVVNKLNFMGNNMYGKCGVLNAIVKDVDIK